MEDCGNDITPFSYDILDQEAEKISALMLAVQQRRIKGGERMALDLFAWAEELYDAGRRCEAEFLYLHTINSCQVLRTPPYPLAFRGLREYAQLMISLTIDAVADETSTPVEVVEPFSAAA
jgi:hypothetical protein